MGKEHVHFNVCLGNPPYQENDGGGGGSAVPVYQKFYTESKKFTDKYISLIMPARWYSGGRGLDEFRSEVLNDQQVSRLIDYPISTDLFPNVEIKGGVCILGWKKGHTGDCHITTVRGNDEDSAYRPLIENEADNFVRYHKGASILEKVLAFHEPSFDQLVSSSKPFGLRTYVKGTDEKKNRDDIKLYGNKSVGWIDPKEIKVNQDLIPKFKVYITYAYGAGEDFPHQIINKPFIGEPNSACTETYLVIAPSGSEQYCKNVLSYMRTKFFRFMVLLLKSTQHATKAVYKYVPIQDFSSSYTDELLYKKYGLSDDEINFIESMIRPMEVDL